MNQHYGPVWISGVPLAVNELHWWHVSLFLNYTFLLCSMFSHFPSPALQLLLIAGFHPTTIYLVLKDAVVVWKTISIFLGYKYLLTLSLTEIISDFGILCLYLPNFSLSSSCCSHPTSYVLCFPFSYGFLNSDKPSQGFSLILDQPSVCLCTIWCPRQLSLLSFS